MEDEVVEFGEIGKGDFAPGEFPLTNKKGEAKDLAFKNVIWSG